MGRVFNNTLNGSVTAVEKSGILLQTGEVAEASDGHLTRLVFILEDPIAHLEISNPSGILIIEK